MYIQRTTTRRIIRFTILGALLLGLSSCTDDYYDDTAEYADGDAGAVVGVSLNLQARAMSNIASGSETYVQGTQWENYINIVGGDYHIYFFTYDPQTETGSGSGSNSILIAEFAPTDIYSTDAGVYTSYTLSGEMGEETVAELDNFKVLVVANWGVGNYPEVTPGTTTIDDICSAQTAVFNAFVDDTTSPATALIPSYNTLYVPFFGLREYTGVTWTAGRMTRLSGDITMLRAVAKVEVIASEDNDDDLTFDDVSIVNYNSQGYCAPSGVYLREDYDHNYTWGEDFVDDLHLWNNSNDSEGKTMGMLKTDATASTQETWTCYLTEYDNTSNPEDYSYINVTIDGVEYPVYFGNYHEGVCTAYETGGDTDERFDVYRNYLYRFYVTKTEEEEKVVTIRVYVTPWERLAEEAFTL